MWYICMFSNSIQIQHGSKALFVLLSVELVFQEHKRTVNRIQFHPFEKDLLLSGSQDGTMKFFVSVFILHFPVYS